jgi:hypothetical protein
VLLIKQSKDITAILKKKEVAVNDSSGTGNGIEGVDNQQQQQQNNDSNNNKYHNKKAISSYIEGKLGSEAYKRLVDKVERR